MLYFDHCASTPPHEAVVQTMAEVMKLHYANPSSLHRSGVEASRLIERARSLAAELFGTKPEEWVFTSGGTEGNNLALIGAARHYRSRGEHIVITEIEHSSVYEAAAALEREGFRVTRLPVGPGGHVRLADVEAALRDDTILVSVMHVNNEVGSVQPIEAIGRLLADRPKTLLHVDAVQSAGKLPVRPREWGVDLMTLSAHKLRGPKGVGWLYVRDGVRLEPLLHGGGHNGGRRAGTENVPAIVAAAKALRLAVKEQPHRQAKMAALRSRLAEGIAALPELALSGSPAGEDGGEMAPHIVHFCYPGMKPEVLVHLLEEHGIIASTKSACSSKEDKPSRVLLAMGKDEACAGSGVRISMGDEHEERDIDILLERLRAVVRKLEPLARKGAAHDI